MNDHFNIKHIGFIILVLLIFILSGCCPTTSLHPLSDPDHLTFDERLFGAWQATIDNSPVYLHIGKGKDNFTMLLLVGNNGNGFQDTMTFTVFPASIDGDGFLNVQSLSQLEEKFDGYIFAMYEIIDYNRLHLFTWDEEAIEKAIREGRLKGEITEKHHDTKEEQDQIFKGKTKCVRITDDREHMIKFFQSYGIRKLFNHAIEPFERIGK
jgi:hypothetical protein